MSLSTLPSYYSPSLDPVANNDPPRRLSSASVIAKISARGFPRKIQPQSSATRDQGPRRRSARLQEKRLRSQKNNAVDMHPPSYLDYANLDAVDAEAGSILISLANHDPNPVVAPPKPEEKCDRTTQPVRSSSTSSTTSTTSTESVQKSPESSGNHSMSISNLLGNEPNNNEPRSPALMSQQGLRDSDHVTETDESDPIMILAAAAAVVCEQDKKNGFDPTLASSSKRKWHGFITEEDTSAAESHAEKRHRHYESSTAWTPESTWKHKGSMNQHDGQPGHSKDSFSWQYLSMKQNPRIKRNAMHAYISYMIYTDMAHEQSRADSKDVDRPCDTASPPPEYRATESYYSHTLSSGKPNATAESSTTLSDPWYPFYPSSREDSKLPSPAPPPLSSTAIVDRPLTAFLRDDALKKEPGFSLPPLAPAIASTTPATPLVPPAIASPRP